MGHLRAKATTGDFYPPRARWYSRLLFGISGPVRRRFSLERFHVPGQPGLGALLLSVALPGYSLVVQGRKLLGALGMALYLLAGAVSLVALGFLSGSIAYGVMISLHASSIFYLESLWLKQAPFKLRLGLALCTLVGVWCLLYEPCRSLVERRWFTPLRRGERVLVVARALAPGSIGRGDWLAYEIPQEVVQRARVGPLYLQAGFGLEPVLALPGDRVRFSQGALFVNEQALPRQPHMPTSGEVLVPQKVWFIWPTVAINRGDGAPEADIAATLQEVALVHQDQLLGRPYRSWFGRHQWP